MKIIIPALFSLIGFLSTYAQTSKDSSMRAVAIVDGLFFDESVHAKSLIPENSTMAVLKDPEGKMVINGIVRFAKVGATEENQAEVVSVIEELSRK